MLKKGSRAALGAVLQDFLEKFGLFSGTFDGLWTNWGIGELNLGAGSPQFKFGRPDL